MYTISKEFHFSAGHVLTGLPENHPCSRIHGHNYIVKIILEDPFLTPTGFVKDYRELEMVKQYIDEKMDHRMLNDLFSFNPSAENIAKHIYDTFHTILSQMIAVEVSETPKTNARYEP